MSPYERALRLRRLRLTGWQREAATWGAVVLGVLLALTGLVSPWGIVALPVLVALVLKGHDLLSGRLAAGHPLPPAPNRPADSNEPPVGSTGGSES